MIKINGIDVVNKTREFLNTPYVKQAKLKGQGIDCVQLLIAVFQEMGTEIPDYNDYHYGGDYFDVLINKLSEYCDEIAKDQIGNGDILIFRKEGSKVNGEEMYNHAGIYSKEKNTFIHAYGRPSTNKVTEEEYSRFWRIYTSKIFRYRGVII